MSEVARLSSRYAGAILVDSNILLLLFVGLFDRSRISKFKNTASRFIERDFDTLRLFLAPFRTIVATPHILTEVSNLSGQLGEPVRSDYFAKFKSMLSLIDERHVSCQIASGARCFDRLGLTDAGIAQLAAGQLPVLTVDLDLWLELQSLGVDAVNFNHIRTRAWQ